MAEPYFEHDGDIAKLRIVNEQLGALVKQKSYKDKRNALIAVVNSGLGLFAEDFQVIVVREGDRYYPVIVWNKDKQHLSLYSMQAGFVTVL